MAIGPEDARIVPLTQEQYTAWLELQIDAWLTTEWHEPSRTCFPVPAHLKSHTWYGAMLADVLEKYRPLWQYVHVISPDARYHCDFIVFVTEACDVHTA
ncbi:MAG TPA: hypothetical protein VMU12_00035 [Candidatus Paceibacterota bacterium]|nr:hypothetical protein [Candidatus Paceibacterota bacterium]